MRRAATQKGAIAAGFVPAIRAPAVRAMATNFPERPLAAGRKPSLSSLLKRSLMAFPAAVISLFVSSEPALADLKLCNRMSYVVEAAVGIDVKSTTATRGWFRIDPAACRVVVQGTLNADRILLNARALPLYGASP